MNKVVEKLFRATLDANGVHLPGTSNVRIDVKTLREAIDKIDRLRAAKVQLDDALTTVLYDLQHAGIELAPDVLRQAEEALDE